jgi:hypothetical protein
VPNATSPRQMSAPTARIAGLIDPLGGVIRY